MIPKGRVVVDIRVLNRIVEPDAYPTPTQMGKKLDGRVDFLVKSVGWVESTKETDITTGLTPPKWNNYIILDFQTSVYSPHAPR
ncbi:hypothetical protein DTO195F2_7817 [Paecilomyces variotii]|nr:hypothetical protein DTO195F2_7817 [Paecilomyces variotii]KAJ9374731.1 hypothetical protein DTO282E5_814 [Paecilomyces variotii]